MDKWIPFIIVNVVIIVIVFYKSIFLIPLIILTTFDFLFFSLFDRLKFDKFKFALSKEGLSIIFDEVVEKFQNQLKDIDFEAEEIKINKEDLKRELSKANDITDVVKFASELTFKYTMEAVAKKQVKAKKMKPEKIETIFKTKQISPALDEIFKET